MYRDHQINNNKEDDEDVDDKDDDHRGMTERTGGALWAGESVIASAKGVMSCDNQKKIK